MGQRPQLRSWDIFCNVVDNFGDIGVSWRLTRQLAAGYNFTVRLWVDDVASLCRLYPDADESIDRQSCQGVEVHHWQQQFPDVAPADAVIAAFGCALPAAYLAAMAQRQHAPVWINLEYLSAETWVADCHALPSPRPEPGLTQHFFFPGFTPGTGGLLRETDLLARRDAFQANASAVSDFWTAINMPAPESSAFKVSLFCYENDNIPSLFDCWAAGHCNITCMVPEGRALPQVQAWLGASTAKAGDIFRRGSLELRVLPFVAQDRYDELLWLSDLNFVRGEDSFVRAQWAGIPMIWQIYPQEEMAHWPKLQAFLDIYEKRLDPPDAAAIRLVSEAWNIGAGASQAWPGYMAAHKRLLAHANHWARDLKKKDSRGLTANLVDFCEQIQNNAQPKLER